MSDVIIRLFQVSDLNDVIRLWYDTWHITFPQLKHPDSIETWRQRFQDKIIPHKQVWLATIADKCVGLLVVDKTQGYLDQLFIDADYQQRGIGRLLLDKAKSISPVGLTLHTLISNHIACQFYEKHGFIRGKEGINQINGQKNVSYHWQAID
ncbi:MAG: GNAT family N-acetyltransferase [Chloroflexota bacterium]